MDDWRYKPATDLNLPHAERMRSLRREAGLFSAAFQHAWWTGVRAYLGLYHRLSITGRENIPPRPPFVMIANHASHLDVMCLAAALPARLRAYAMPIAAGDTFFTTPVRSTLSAMMLNALPMWRHNCGRHALADLRARLDDGECIFILFPEGTRSRDGQMGPFKPGLGMIVAGAAAPVIPCHIAGAFEAFPPDRRLPRPRRLRLRIGPPLVFQDEPNKRTGWERVCQALERAVHNLAETDTP